MKSLKVPVVVVCSCLVLNTVTPFNKHHLFSSQHINIHVVNQQRMNCTKDQQPALELQPPNRPGRYLLVPARPSDSSVCASGHAGPATPRRSGDTCRCCRRCDSGGGGDDGRTAAVARRLASGHVSSGR